MDGTSGVRLPVAVALAVVSFVALAIFGLGMTSLALDADVIAVEGLGLGPGVLGLVCASGGFAAALALSLRVPHPTFWAAPIVAIAAFLGEVLGVLIGGLAADVGGAVAAAGSVAAGWPGLVIAAAALLAAWGGIALTRTRAQGPRWPWERDDPEE